MVEELNKLEKKVMKNTEEIYNTKLVLKEFELVNLKLDNIQKDLEEKKEEDKTIIKDVSKIKYKMYWAGGIITGINFSMMLAKFLKVF